VIKLLAFDGTLPKLITMLARDRHWSLSENVMLVVFRSLNSDGIEISICLWLENYRIDELSRGSLRFS